MQNHFSNQNSNCMSSMLPKARSRAQSGAMNSPSAHKVGALQNLSNKGRNFSKSARQASTRITSRGELFNRIDLEDAIHFEDNKHTILSNFEEWIKLATDNKITSKNSWQIALIDYFKDLNVIKDGENINFQRASATLDGCVKIYSSRVESAANETGKLLSGLAKKSQANDALSDTENDENGDAVHSDANGESNINDRKKRKMNRIVESTLVEFDTIRVKKLDQELAIDPLFKKALSEFDEGGAKSLLLNTLSIDKGRVVFATAAAAKEDGEEEEEINKLVESNKPLDSSLEDKIFQMGERLSGVEDTTICPSLEELKLVLTDINQAKKVLGEVNTRFMEEKEPSLEPSPFILPEFDDYGEENISNHFNESIVRSMIMEDGGMEKPGEYGPTELEPTTNLLDRDLMAYFDRNMKTNWRGPEHWKVQKFKENFERESTVENGNNPSITTNNNQSMKKKEKTQTIINFFEEIDVDEVEAEIFASPKNTLSTTIRPDTKKPLVKNKLPEDIQFNSKRLTSLFLKDKSVVQWRKSSSVAGRSGGVLEQEIQNNSEKQPLTDENYFADQYKQKEEEEERQSEMYKDDNENQNPFFDEADDYGGIDFNDALTGENSETKKLEPPEPLLTAGSVRKARPDYVNFSRIAKRVDVRLLKDNIWKSIKEEPSEEKQFSEVISSIGKMYSSEERKDLSTSFCFICLLHLANEHELTIQSTELHDNLTITGF